MNRLQHQNMKFIFLALTLLFSTIVLATDPTVTTQELSNEIASSISKVEEVLFIRQEAQKIGVHAYLFGGTAAGQF